MHSFLAKFHYRNSSYSCKQASRLLIRPVSAGTGRIKLYSLFKSIIGNTTSSGAANLFFVGKHLCHEACSQLETLNKHIPRLYAAQLHRAFGILLKERPAFFWNDSFQLQIKLGLLRVFLSVFRAAGVTFVKRLYVPEI